MRLSITLTALCAVALSGCTLAPFAGVQTGEALWAQIERVEYREPRDLVYDCVRMGAVLTRDWRACLAWNHKARVCWFMTAPNDRTHDRELTAICNGWRPR